MQHLNDLLTNQPVPWHPALRLSALDAAFLKMSYCGIDTIEKIDKFAVVPLRKFGVSVEMFWFEKDDDTTLLPNLRRMTSLCVFKPVRRTIKKADVTPPEGLEHFDFKGNRRELISYIADNKFLLNHARSMVSRFGARAPGPDVCDLLILVDVYLAAKEFDEVIRLLDSQPPT